jgi:hypothetical protein
MMLADQLRKAIADSEQSLYAIAKGAGLNYGLLWRFKIGERDMRLESAGKVADFLGLELRPARQSKKARGKA